MILNYWKTSNYKYFNQTGLVSERNLDDERKDSEDEATAVTIQTSEPRQPIPKVHGSTEQSTEIFKDTVTRSIRGWNMTQN